MLDNTQAEQRLANMIEEASSHPARQAFMQMRERMWKVYRGKEWLLPNSLDPRPREADFFSKENVVFQGIETITATLSKNNPFYYCTARNPSIPDVEKLAQEMNNFLRYDYELTRMRIVTQEWIRASRIHGLSILKTIWDTTRIEDFGEGINRSEVISMDDVLVYPYAQDLQTAPYIIHKVKRSASDLINDDNYGEEAEQALNRPNLKGRIKAAWDRITEVFSKTEVTSGESRELFDVYEFWLRPYSKVEIETSEGPKRTSQYPYGVVVTMVNGKVVWTRPNPFSNGKLGHRRFPFVAMYCYRHRDTGDKPDIKGSFYDVMGEVEQAEQPQMDMDYAAAAIIANSRVLSNPPLIVDDSMLSMPVDAHEFRATEIIHVKQGGVDIACKFLTPGVVSPSLFQIYEQKKQAVLDAMGVTDYLRGIRPLGLSHTPGIAVQSAQEAGFGRMYPKINLLDQAFIEQGQLLTGNNQQFRKLDAYYALTSEGQQVHQQWTKEHKTTEFTIQVEQGSTTPANDLDRVSNASQLFQLLLPILSLPQIPPQLLDLADWLIRETKLKGTQSLLQLLSQVKQEQGNMQQLLQQLQGMGAGTPEGTVPEGTAPAG